MMTFVGTANAIRIRSVQGERGKYIVLFAVPLWTELAQ